MSVFISWSGKDSRSHKVALLLHDWLPKVMQNLKCFVSSQDIEAGAAWMRTLFTQLEQCNVGLICLTQASIKKPWILFEAGAVAKKFEESRVCPLLIDLQQSDVRDPLAAFICKKATNADMLAVVEMINRSRGENALSKEDLEDSFSNRWPAFEKRFTEIMKERDEDSSDSPAAKATDPLLEELLTLTRQIATQVAKPATGERARTDARFTAQHNPAVNEMINLLRAEVRKRRPLIAGWFNTITRGEIDGDSLVLYLPANASTTLEALNMPRNRDFINSILKDQYGLPFGVAFRLEVDAPDEPLF